MSKVRQHNYMQFGFAENSLTIQAELFIKETIQKYNSEHTPIYLCSLDAEKAFDTCNWLKLLTTLHSKQTVPDLVLKFLIKSYLKVMPRSNRNKEINNLIVSHFCKVLDKDLFYHPFFTTTTLKS